MPVKKQCEKCNATASEGIHLFKFPSNINIRRAWIRFVNNDFIPKSYSTLCSKHFDKNDVIQNKVRVKLRPGAIPLTGYSETDCSPLFCLKTKAFMQIKE